MFGRSCISSQHLHVNLGVQTVGVCLLFVFLCEFIFIIYLFIIIFCCLLTQYVEGMHWTKSCSPLLLGSVTNEPIELFLVPASAPRLVYQRPWCVLSCLWDGVYKRTLAVNRKE